MYGDTGTEEIKNNKDAGDIDSRGTGKKQG